MQTARPNSQSGADRQRNKTDALASYRDERLVDTSLLQQALRTGDGWRRIAFIVAILAVVEGLGWSIEAHKSHTEAVVYHEDSAGDIRLMGRAASNNTPSPTSIEKELRIWISAVRDIPSGTDPEILDRNAHQALSMLAAGSSALADYLANYHREKPLDQSQKGLKRSVTSVRIDKLTELTYQISWSETLRQGQGAPVAQAYTGSVTFAQAPKPPADPRVGTWNPTGIYIDSMNLRAPSL